MLFLFSFPRAPFLIYCPITLFCSVLKHSHPDPTARHQRDSDTEAVILTVTIERLHEFYCDEHTNSPQLLVGATTFLHILKELPDLRVTFLRDAVDLAKTAVCMSCEKLTLVINQLPWVINEMQRLLNKRINAHGARDLRDSLGKWSEGSEWLPSSHDELLELLCAVQPTLPEKGAEKYKNSVHRLADCLELKCKKCPLYQLLDTLSRASDLICKGKGEFKILYRRFVPTVIRT